MPRRSNGPTKHESSVEVVKTWPWWYRFRSHKSDAEAERRARLTMRPSVAPPVVGKALSIQISSSRTPTRVGGSQPAPLLSCEIYRQLDRSGQRMDGLSTSTARRPLLELLLHRREDGYLPRQFVVYRRSRLDICGRALYRRLQ